MANPDYHLADANNLNKKTLINNEQFLSDASDFLIDRKGYDYGDLTTNENIYSLFVSHMRDADVNELTAINDLTHVNEIDNKGKEQVGRLYTTWDRMESGGTTFWEAVKDYGLGVATAPSTYIGLVTGGAGKLVAAGGTMAARVAARQVAVGALKKSIQQTTA